MVVAVVVYLSSTGNWKGSFPLLGVLNGRRAMLSKNLVSKNTQGA